MTNEMIKKTMQNMIKKNGWNKCYGSYGVNLSAGAKQMEKRNMTINFGWIGWHEYDAEAAAEKMENSPEFKEALEQIGGTYERELKADGNHEVLYFRICF